MMEKFVCERTALPGWNFSQHSSQSSRQEALLAPASSLAYRVVLGRNSYMFTNLSLSQTKPSQSKTKAWAEVVSTIASRALPVPSHTKYP